jgi:PIN domain nuclease of toxin-antitoxin system
MSYLLDTHSLLWFITYDKKLPQGVIDKIRDTNTHCQASIVSLWEMGIKNSLGKLHLEKSLKDIFVIIEKSGLTTLSLLPEHILYRNSLPFHHRDAFDRIIIAQAMAEELTIITKDQAFSAYDVKLFWS